MVSAYWTLSVSLFVVALLVRVFPPKGINSFYGYRTAASMKDEVSWKIANDYHSKYLLIIAISIFIFQLLLSFILGVTTVTIVISCIALAGSFISLIVMTERQLKK